MSKHVFDIPNPEFQATDPDSVIALEAGVAISNPNSGNKWTRFSTLRFRTDGISGYPMEISVRETDKTTWHTVGDIGEIRIRIAGDYEADVLKDFFMHVGVLMQLVYGRRRSDDALQEP